jgi:hypothetical protein
MQPRECEIENEDWQIHISKSSVEQMHRKKTENGKTRKQLTTTHTRELSVNIFVCIFDLRLGLLPYVSSPCCLCCLCVLFSLSLIRWFFRFISPLCFCLVWMLFVVPLSIQSKTLGKEGEGKEEESSLETTTDVMESHGTKPSPFPSDVGFLCGRGVSQSLSPPLPRPTHLVLPPLTVVYVPNVPMLPQKDCNDHDSLPLSPSALM